MTQLIVLVLVGLAAQMVDGSLGMAYGVTSSTLLVANGFSPAVASASVHFAEVGTTLISGVSHMRFGNLDWKIILKLGLPGAVGAYAGATFLSNLSTEIAKPWMAGILLSLGTILVVRFAFRGARTDRHHLGFKARFLTPLGLVAGFVDATGGGGWGPVATPTMLISGRTEPRKVIGSVSASEFLVSLAASIGFLLGLGSAGIEWQIALGLLIGGAIAAPFAAWIVSKVAARILGTTVGGLIVITNLRTLLGLTDISDGGSVFVYLVVAAVWAGAVALSIRGHRRDAESEDLDFEGALT